MNKTVERGKTLLVSGPASVTLVKGKSKVLGAPISVGSKLIVRSGKTLPFETEGNSTYDVILGEGANAEEIVGSTIPESWKGAVEEVLSLLKPCTVMIIGDIDCGKTTFCTYLANAAFFSGLKTTIIDADLGQSDLGPPTTIGLSLITRPVVDLFSVKAGHMYFVGLTSPSGVTERVLRGLSILKKKSAEIGVNFTIINTDGWVQGEDAKNYKITTVKKILPEAVVGIQHNNELELILSAIEGDLKVLRLTSSPVVKRRSREERRRLREQGYQKHMRGAVLRLIPLSWIKFEYMTFRLQRSLPSERRQELEEKLGCKILYLEETSDSILLVLERRGKINEGERSRIEEEIRKKVYIINDGEERGLLVGLLDQRREFCGLGVIRDIDYEKRIMKIYTPYRGKIDVVQFGCVKIDIYGRELGLTNFLM